MRNLCLVISLVALTHCSIAQTADPILYGIIKRENLLDTPYRKWFAVNYDTYQPNAEVTEGIKKINTKDISIDIFFGSWCGDSRREVPRFLKLLDDLSFPSRHVRIIGLGGSDSLYKQSPLHEDAGKGIFRVPVFIIYKNGREINRINEYPVYSLEKDLYGILGSQPYMPNYRSFDMIRAWLANGTLADKNSNIRGLAMQLKTLVAGEGELNSLGYLLQKQGKITEGLKLFEVNAHLYPESANVFLYLGEGYYKAGDNKNAALYLERSLELNKEPARIKEILKVLYKAKELKE
jgi:tetratricopeptide (TPR) repeat protein